MGTYKHVERAAASEQLDFLVSYWTLAGKSNCQVRAAAAQGDKMQAEEDYEALVAKAKEGDADAIEEWLSSLARDPNSQVLGGPCLSYGLRGVSSSRGVGSGDVPRAAPRFDAAAAAPARSLASRAARVPAVDLWVFDCCKFPGEEVALRARFCRQGGRGGPCGRMVSDVAPRVADERPGSCAAKMRPAWWMRQPD